MASNQTPDRNHTNKAKPAKNFGEPGWGDGATTAATAEGAEKLTVKAFSADTKIGFTGAVKRRRVGGIVGKILDVLFGKDPEIFDVYGRVRHKFDDAKWAAWDARIRKNPAYDWRRHSGADKSRGDKSRK
jgi:hypothetical protein